MHIFFTQNNSKSLKKNSRVKFLKFSIVDPRIRITEENPSLSDTNVKKLSFVIISTNSNKY